jgi:FSR family fosmidomycin resistance protein-like MFS transporter
MRDERSGIQVLLLLIAGHFFVDFYGSFLSPLQPFLVTQHQLSLTMAGFLAATYSISASLMQPVYGYLADRLRRNFFVVAGPLFAAAFMTLLPHANRFSVLVLCLILGGVGVASFHPQGSSLSHEISGKKKGIAMSMFISGGNFGSAVGPLFLMFIITRGGLNSTYWLAVPGVFISLALFLFSPASATLGSPRTHDALIQEIKSSIKPLANLYALVVFRTLVQLSFLHFTAILLKQMNFSAVAIGFAITAYMTAGAIGGVVGGFLYDRIGGRTLFIASSLLSGLLLSLMFLVQSSPQLMIVCFALGGFSLMMTIPVSVLMGQSILPNAISTVSSFMMGFGWGAGGMMIPLVGAFADATSVPTALRSLALVPLFYLPFAFRLPKKIRKGAVPADVAFPVLEN